MPYIYIAYSTEKPYLPIATGDNAQELANKVGVSKVCIHSVINRYERGITKKSRYMRVCLEDENNE